MNDTLKKFIENAGWPRVIIGLFLASLFVVAPFVNVRVDTSLSDTLVRVGMNGVLVLAMVPMVQSGCGLNFGLPLGINSKEVWAFSPPWEWQSPSRPFSAMHTAKY